MNEQKEWFEKLEAKCFPEIKVANDSLNQATKDYRPGMRCDKNKYQFVDQRTVFVNEIIFDLDYKSYVRNYNIAKQIIDVLETRGIKPIITATGGKGIHLHIFFDKLDFKIDKEKEIMKEAFSYGLTWKRIRTWFFNTVLEEAGIPKEDYGTGKAVDSNPINFNYFEGTTRLIRAVGGRKYSKKAGGEFEKMYKTYIPFEMFNKQKVKVHSFERVEYPEKVELFKIDIYELVDFLEKFIEHRKSLDVEQLSNQRLNIKYIDIDGVLKIREGMGTGKRSLGAMVISVACKIDKLSKDDSEDVLNEYVKCCSSAGHRFSLAEALQWRDWVYSSENTYWNCQQLRELEVHNEYSCEFCRSKNKEAIEFLTKTTLLKQIQEALDIEIVGEYHTKMLTFLLTLSKDFPSSTGTPKWNIPGDPMSQNIILASDSSSGKTYMIKKILELFGELDEDYFVISRMSKTVINYMTDVNMDGKIIFIEEMQGLDENTSQLRVWMSEGRLSFDTVEKVKNEEGIEVNAKVKKVTKGQPCFITCQAEGIVEDQLNNRSWVLSMDVSEKQTGKILKYQSDMNQGKVKVDKKKVRLIKDALKQLKPYHFKIPFADHEAMGIPIKDVRSRRDFERFLTLIKCITYVHQKQREVIEDGGNEFLIADIKDYDIARQYSEGILGATFSGLTNVQIDLINFLKNSSFGFEFSISDVMRNLGKSKPYWRNNLKQMEDMGFITATRAMGNETIFSIVDNKDINIINLPNGEELLKRLEKISEKDLKR